MTSSHPNWAGIAELFDELVELDNLRREQRLDEIRRVSPAQADELAALLAADAIENPLLDADANAIVPELMRRDTATPTSLGAYRLLRVLGEGGMGVVWLAERSDGAYEQNVAIKLLKRGMDSNAILRRFLQERRILASLQHPHIVHLVDGGISDDGRPYFAMEYVDAETITDYATGKRLTVRDRLVLLASVADAVAYAHSQLVVHRDLKPGNVLVNKDGTPRVLDFGIAKLLLESGEQTRTGTGLRVLSPAYAAPEQILGEPVSTATDVYALGLMLCELLVGQIPLQRRNVSAEQLARDVTIETTERASHVAARNSAERIVQMYGGSSTPRQLAHTLSGDLDLIIATALRREPMRRYQTASALADDLRRWLDGRPITARADSTRYRFNRFVRRHRAGVAATTLVAVSLVAGLAAALWQAELARTAAQRADSERTQAQRQLARTRQVKDFMLTLFREQDPMSRAKAQARSPSELIADGVAQVDTALATQPELQAELLRDLGEIQTSLGDPDAARQTLKRAFDQQSTLSGPDSTQTADAQAAYAAALLASGDTKSAEPLLRTALDRLRATLGPNHIKTVDAEATLARIDILFSRSEEALALLQHGVEVYSATYGAQSAQLAPRLAALAAVQIQMSQFAETIATSRHALQIIEHNNGPDHVRTMAPHTQIADAFRYQQKYAEALPEMEAAVRIGRNQLPPGHPLFAGVLVRYGDLLRRMKRYDEAEVVFAEGLGSLKGAKTGEYAQMLQVYGTLASARGRLDLAAQRYHDSFEVFRAATGDSTYTWLTALLHVDALTDLGKLDEADKLATEAANVLARIAAGDSYEDGYAAGVIGVLRLRQGRIAESVSLIRHALAVMTATYGENHAEVAGLRFMLARSLAAAGDPDSEVEAAKLIELSLPTLQASDPHSPQLGEAHLIRANLRLRNSDRAGAGDDVRAAIPLLTGPGAGQSMARQRAQALAAELGIKPAS